MALQDNVAARKAARQQGIEIENARPVTAPVLPTSRTVRGVEPDPTSTGDTSSVFGRRRQQEQDREQRKREDLQFKGGESGREFDTSGATFGDLRINPRRALENKEIQDAQHQLRVRQEQLDAGKDDPFKFTPQQLTQTQERANRSLFQDATTSDTSKNVSDTAQNLAKQDVEERLKNAGITGKGLALANVLNARGITNLSQISRGGSSGNLTLFNIDPEFRQALEEAGLVRDVSRIEGDEVNKNVVLSIGEDEFNDVFKKFNFIKEGKDIDEAFSKVGERTQFDIKSSFSEGQRTTQEDEDVGIASQHINTQMNQFINSLESATQGLSPEDASYMGTLINSLGDLETDMNNSIASNTGMASALLNGGTVDLGNGMKISLTGTNTVANQAQQTLNNIATRAQQSANQVNELLEDSRVANEKYLAAQEESQINSNVWAESQALKEIARRKTQRHDEMVAQLAIAGGFGQEAGLRAVRASDDDFDQAMQETRTQFGFKRSDIISKFVGFEVENQNNYNNGIISNLKEMDAKLDTLSFKSIESEQVRANAENTIVTNLFANIEKLRADKVTKTNATIKSMRDIIKEDKESKAQTEQNAIDQIEFLAKNYAPEDVADAIGELAEDITSFDASDLAGKPFGTAKQRKAGAGGGIGGGFGGRLPVPEKKPMMSFSEFTSNKINEFRDRTGLPVNAEAREGLVKTNNDIWRKEYEALVAPSADSMPSSGNESVDLAAQMVLNGDFGGVDPIERAAETFGVTRSAVAAQKRAYEENGYVPDFPQFTDTQVERYEPFVKRIRNTDEYKSAANATFIVRRIGAALSVKTGQGDSTAVELLQRGIKDPGMAVRQDDIARIVAAVPWIDKWNPEQITNKILVDGRLFNDHARQQFNDVLMVLGQETIDAYNEEILPRVRQEAKRLGLPESAFRTVNDLEAFGDSLDDVISSHGYGSPE